MHKIITDKGLLYLFELFFGQQEADRSRKKIIALKTEGHMQIRC